MENRPEKGSSDALCSALMETLALFEKAQRRFHPAVMAQHGVALQEKALVLQKAMDEFSPGAGKDNGERAGEVFMEASRLVAGAIARYGDSPGDLQTGVMNALRAGRKVCQAFELLFGLRHEIPAADYFFREDHCPDAPGGDDRIMHIGPEDSPYARGSASLYIPGSSDGHRPLVVALHGGFGHGRDFIWTWIRQARSRRFYLLAPASTGETWSIMDPAADLLPMLGLMDRLSSEFPLDTGRVLLSGFSDGATFCLGCSMQPHARFSAFNPISGVLPPCDLSPVRSRRIFWIHGTHDWMFPVSRAKWGSEILSKAGADVTLKVMDDLAHALPKEVNPEILSWFDPGLFPLSPKG
jgi:phospholipase/carboxylesterase